MIFKCLVLSHDCAFTKIGDIDGTKGRNTKKLISLDKGRWTKSCDKALFKLKKPESVISSNDEAHESLTNIIWMKEK